MTGNAIGASNVPLAKRIFTLSITFAIFVQLLVCLIVYVERYTISSLMTDGNEEIIPLCANVLILVCLENFFDGLTTVEYGLVRSLGL